jgi:putative peptidoglycan lipid II flippase
VGTTSTQETPLPDRLARFRGGRSAALVGAGILLSRLAGLVRQRVFAHYLGNSAAADVFSFAFRVPNVLQNLFGEGVLSASFIPVYAGLVARGDEEEAGRIAGAVAAVLALAMAVLVLLGIALAPVLVPLLAPGFDAEKRALAVTLVRILFPGAALLALSAWALGVLNSHGRFLWSYTAPVLWNAAMIAALAWWGGRVDESSLVVVLAWGSVAGSVLQLVVQLPGVLRLARGLRVRLDVARAGVRTVLGNVGPVIAGRGVTQLSGYLDTVLASLVAPGAVAALGYAQLVYMLPVSLFGMSVSAAELPAMSREFGAAEDVAAVLRARLAAALARVTYFVVPSAVAFVALGDLVVGAIYQGGAFGADDVRWVWGILAGSAVGLLAGTRGRLLASAWYALRDTRRPTRIALLRVLLTVVFGLVLAFPVREWLGLAAPWGVAGLTVGAGAAAWVEYRLLRASLFARIGHVGQPMADVATLWGVAGIAAASGWGMKLVLVAAPPLVTALGGLAAFGTCYLLGTAALGVGEARALLRRVHRR